MLSDYIYLLYTQSRNSTPSGQWFSWCSRKATASTSTASLEDLGSADEEKSRKGGKGKTNHPKITRPPQSQNAPVTDCMLCWECVQWRRENHPYPSQICMASWGRIFAVCTVCSMQSCSKSWMWGTGCTSLELSRCWVTCNLHTVYNCQTDWTPL